MENAILTKGISEGFKDVDLKTGVVSGMFAAFGSKDSDGDIIMPGAFLDSIKKHGPNSSQPRIKHLLDHDRKNAVGKLTELFEDEKGLNYVSTAGRHTKGRDFLLMVEDGIITEHSHGFHIESEQQKSDANYIYKSFLYEGSSLQFWGSNGNTPITGVKSAEELIQLLNTIEKGLKNGKYSDEAFIQLEARFKELYNALPTYKSEPVTEKSLWELLTLKD